MDTLEARGKWGDKVVVVAVNTDLTVRINVCGKHQITYPVVRVNSNVPGGIIR